MCFAVSFWLPHKQAGETLLRLSRWVCLLPLCLHCLECRAKRKLILTYGITYWVFDNTATYHKMRRNYFE